MSSNYVPGQVPIEFGVECKIKSPSLLPDMYCNKKYKMGKDKFYQMKGTIYSLHMLQPKCFVEQNAT